jgi:hypothetical protein
MKKIISLFAVAAIGAALIGCSSGDAAADEAAKPAADAAKTETPKTTGE